MEQLTRKVIILNSQGSDALDERAHISNVDKFQVNLELNLMKLSLVSSMEATFNGLEFLRWLLSTS